MFFFFIQLITIGWGVGYEIPIQYPMFLALSILFFVIGELLRKTKRNWFIGIRTPWTLSSDEVWDKTNKLGSLLFKVDSILIILALLFGETNMWIIVGSILLMVAVLFYYSYREFQKLVKK